MHLQAHRESDGPVDQAKAAKDAKVSASRIFYMIDTMCDHYRIFTMLVRAHGELMNQCKLLSREH